MADIITGKGLSLQYNTDTGNRSPQGVGNITINEVNTFPILTIHSETNTFDTYDSEYNSVLLSDKTVEPFQIVVNYLPDDPTHMFLDGMAESQGNFQCIIQYELNSDDSTITYAIVNGYITSTELTGDKDTVVSKSYTFTPEDVIARMSTVQAYLPLLQGDYGVGANGVDIPQYEPDVPDGNSFIKVPSSQAGNPAGSDMLGIGLVDGTSAAEFAMTKTGTLSLFAKNGSTAWTRIYTATQMDARYVPLTRTINGHDLTSNVTVTKSDVGLGTVIDAPQLTVANNLSDLANKTTARSNLGVYSTGQVDTRLDNLNTALSTDISNLNTTLSTNISDVNTKVDNLSTNVSTNYVPKTTTVNGHALSSNVTVTKSDVGLGNVTNDVQLKKASNLSDVADMNATRSNLKIDTLDRSASYSFVYSPDFTHRLLIGNNGSWALQDSNTGVSTPLGVDAGGTGAKTIVDARTNLELFRERRLSLDATQDLNSITGNFSGAYCQNSNVNATTANHYPVQIAGSLLVLSTGAGNSCTQIYTLYNVNKSYRRAYNDEDKTWSNWTSFVMAADIISIAQGGTGASTLVDARSNLQVDRFGQNTASTFISAPTGTDGKVNFIQIVNDNSWGAYKSGVGAIALSVANGGTGALTVAGAKANLGLDNIERGAGYSYYYSDNKAYRIAVGDNGNIVFQNSTTGNQVALPVSSGGTGASTPGIARQNLGVNLTPNKWYQFNNPAVTARVNFPGIANTNENEILTCISKGSIRIRGILRYNSGAAINGSTLIYVTPIDIDGVNRVAISTFAPVSVNYYSAGSQTASQYLNYSASVDGSTMAITFNGQPDWISWIMFDITIAFL